MPANPPDFAAVRKSMQTIEDPDVRKSVLGINDGVMALPPFARVPPSDSPTYDAGPIGRLMAYLANWGGSAAKEPTEAPPAPTAAPPVATTPPGASSAPASIRSLLKAIGR